MWTLRAASLAVTLLCACGPMPHQSAPVACPATRPTASADTTLYDSTGVDTQARRVSGPVPQYPDELRQRGVDGRVVVEFVVGTNGRVEAGSVQVVQLSNIAFVSVSLEAVRASVFCPALRRGLAVRYHMRVPVNYQIWRGN